VARSHGVRATRGDWETHLNTLFPEARLKRTLEMRGADAQGAALWPALPALFKGLLYDDEARLVTVLKRGLAFDATVSPPRTSPEWSLADGRLFDTRVDPRGTRDVAAARRADAAELAADAELFLDLYPWLALTGRAGLPPAAPSPARPRWMPSGKPGAGTSMGRRRPSFARTANWHLHIPAWFIAAVAVSTK